MIKYSLYNESHYEARLKVTEIRNKYIFEYPCENNHDCTDYVITFSPGVYKFELYGASGGSSTGHVSSYRYPNGSCIEDEIVESVKGNVKCLRQPSLGGAGAYISGTIYLSNETIAYATIGGRGIYKLKSFKNVTECYAKENMTEGGYGGGGYAANYISLASSGGGQTAVKFVKNDLWHRVIVSGAGGGSDNGDGTFLGADDGAGGSGGLEGQGWLANGVYNSAYLANLTFGFSFGSGESAQETKSLNPQGVQSNYVSGEHSGAGSGWFGGFASHHANGGSGGGSSWILSRDAIIPENELVSYDSFYDFLGTSKYAFTKADYIFNNVIDASGVWEGNGKLVITILNFINCPTVCV
ncbi:hypothetical protein TVAG_066340 [Trichomonas vaginalis G3]|uniref:receptor protein-tyrosine kinase n=1 Tax=Trichomonas vaginalis (strain ATCC PRA-98 / G3) TaxID=412133 RepID=A2FFG7_TRIV3|nr:glycine-rich protein family [Trichomonas vaginalis G3]EAX96337.1 hypothetical protein TVAG_066340 [Trichomonas vaginalis G3]KAI5520124.1 glycine-rich protein family [Trichomonas vaginalis G3]|eukprot:XP_001309267.1 hypothetical protein [Trichomonas vaginalis G3]